MVWHIHGHCVMQVLTFFTDMMPRSLSVQSSGDFPRSQFCHPISNEKTNDSKRCAFCDRHDVVRCTGIDASNYDSHLE